METASFVNALRAVTAECHMEQKESKVGTVAMQNMKDNTIDQSWNQWTRKQKDNKENKI